jgi:hypothetical protein
VTIEDGSEVDADSFLMKGSHVRAGARWRGNPASELRPGDEAADGARQRELQAA